MHNKLCYICNNTIQHKRLKKYCRSCLDDRKRLITPTESEEERMQPTKEPLIIEDRRLINKNVEVNLSMLYDYFKERYNITETEQHIFNLWLTWSREIGSGRRD